MAEQDPMDKLLAEWKAPAAPPSLERRVFQQESWLDWLLGGAIRVPVPVALALVLAVLAAAITFERRPPLRSTASNIEGFEPVKEIRPQIIRRIP